MKQYRRLLAVVIIFFCITPAIVRADTLDVLRQLQSEVLFYSQVIASGSLTPEKVGQIKAGLADISARLAVLAVDPNGKQALNDAIIQTVRTDIKKITVTGNAINMTSSVEIVYNPEEINGVLLPAATSTVRLPRTQSLYQELEKAARADELMVQAKQAILPTLAITPEAYDTLVDYSIRQYATKAEVEALLRAVGEDNFPIDIGVLSIISDVSVIAGQNIFRMTINSSQNESLDIIISPNTYYCKGDVCIRPNRYDYVLQYKVLGVVVGTLESKNFTQSGMVDEILLENLFAGIGETMTPRTSDRRVVTELVDFAVNSPTYYQYKSRGGRSKAQVLTQQEQSETCHPPYVQEVMRKIVSFFLDGEKFQVPGPLTDIMTLRAPLIAFDDINGVEVCQEKSVDFFPTFK